MRAAPTSTAAPPRRTARAFGYTTCNLPRRTRACDALLELCHTTPFGFSWPEGLLLPVLSAAMALACLSRGALLRVVWRGRTDGVQENRFSEGAIRQARNHVEKIDRRSLGGRYVRDDSVLTGQIAGRRHLQVDKTVTEKMDHDARTFSSRAKDQQAVHSEEGFQARTGALDTERHGCDCLSDGADETGCGWTSQFPTWRLNTPRRTTRATSCSAD